ncbi:hypothetical protein WICPIJ_004128 [Wickerhamomyces pijperi]|uniref:Uncharacterized protein n=1 Tax=Wickerhamomyces pijperi TaxID=599730 RepID=A0A9P8TN79_WICPI|nr:hypothetical protein WICPIJ_004128 [Wickerhamomyces pijperi]
MGLPHTDPSVKSNITVGTWEGLPETSLGHTDLQSFVRDQLDVGLLDTKGEGSDQSDNSVKGPCDDKGISEAVITKLV